MAAIRVPRVRIAPGHRDESEGRRRYSRKVDHSDTTGSAAAARDRIRCATRHQLEYHRHAVVTNPTKNEPSPPSTLPQCWLLNNSAAGFCDACHRQDLQP